MNVKDWSAFLRKGRPRTLKLAQLSKELTDAVGAVSNVVHVNHEYAVKCAVDHQLLAAHFPMLDETIDRGMVLRDGNQHLVFFHFDPYVWNRWFRVTIKRCNEREMLWLSTFHKTELAQVRSKKRRLPLLREAKE